MSFLRRARARFANPVVVFAAGVTLLAGRGAKAANTEYDVIPGQTDLTAPATYTTGGTPGTGANGTVATAGPTVTSDVTFDSVAYNPAAFTLNSSQTFGSLNDLSTTAITIANTSTTGTGDTLTLGGAGDTGSSVPGSSAGDLLFVGTGANLSINSGAAGTATALGLALGQSGNFNVAGTATINSVVSGGFGFTKTGAGTLTLNGANTYTGTTSVTGGTLSVNGTGALGAAPAAFVANQLTLDGGTLITQGNITLAANQGVTLGAGGGTINAANNTTDTLNGIVAGSGSLTVITGNASGRAVVLNGANTFSGGVIVGGVSQISVGSSNGLGTGTLTYGTTGSALTPQFRLSAGGINLPNAITVTAGGTRIIQNNVAGTTTLSGPITLAAGVGAVANPTLTFGTTQGNSSLVVTGGITGTGNVAFANGVNGRTGTTTTISGASVNNVGTVSNTEANNTGTDTISAVIGTNVTGVIQNSTKTTLVLSGLNTFFGDTTVTAGTLNLQNANTLANSVVNTNATAGSLTFGSGATNITAAQIGGLRGAGSATAGSFGDIVLVNSGTTGGALALSIGNSNVSNGNATNPNTLNPSYAGIISGAGSITKTGSNTQTLTGVNTYTGATTVSGGTLALAATAGPAVGATSSIAINSGGTLAFGATNQVNIATKITLGSGPFDTPQSTTGMLNFAAGASQGTAATVTGGTVMGRVTTGGTVTGTTTAGLGMLTANGASTIVFGGGSTTLVFSGLSIAPDASGNDSVLTIRGYVNTTAMTPGNSGAGTDDRLIFQGDQAGFLQDFNFGAGPGTGVTEVALDNGYFEVIGPTAVPEPSTLAASASLLGAMAWYLRRRRRNA